MEENNACLGGREKTVINVSVAYNSGKTIIQYYHIMIMQPNVVMDVTKHMDSVKILENAHAEAVGKG